jgi:diguanylate cyclase
MRRYGSPLSVLFMDLDEFKRVNDEHGHLTGDEVLRLVAQTLRSDVRYVDTASRYGGEEFVLLLPNTDLEGARAVFERMRDDLAGATKEKLGFAVTMSAGAIEAREGSTAADLLAAADEAMYRAKRQGKNRLAT